MKLNSLLATVVLLLALHAHYGFAVEKKLYRVFVLTNKSSPPAKLADKSLVFTDKTKVEKWRREKSRVGDIRPVGELQKLFYFETEKKAGGQVKALLEKGFNNAEEAKEWVKAEVSRAEDEPKSSRTSASASSGKQQLPASGTSFTLIHAGFTGEYELQIAEMPNVQIMDEGEVVEAKGRKTDSVQLKFNHSVPLTPMK